MPHQLATLPVSACGAVVHAAAPLGAATADERADYLAVRLGADHIRLAGQPHLAPWDPEADAVMATTGRALCEESVARPADRRSRISMV